MSDNDIKIPSEFYTAFNDVKYFDEPHTYHVGENQLVSVTSLIHDYVEPFDEQYWLLNKAEEYNLPTYKIKRCWKFLNVKGTLKGSIVHDYIENMFLNKVFKYPKNEIIDQFGFDPILKEYEITKKHVHNFYNDSYDKLIPIKTELVVRDIESLIGGMVDMLFYNKKTNEFQIWDWKTNKKFSYESEYRMKGDLFFLQASDFEIYSMQLSMYKYIIEKYVPIKLGNSYLVWFSHNNDNYKVIETKDRSYYVKNIVDKRIEEIKKVA